MGRSRSSSIQVKQTASEVVPGLMMETCGSYRRLKSSCGDIDILMTFKDGRKHAHDTVLAPLLDKLKEIGRILDAIIGGAFRTNGEVLSGFLTHDLLNHSETASSSGDVTEQMNYFGVCRLPEAGALVDASLEMSCMSDSSSSFSIVVST